MDALEAVLEAKAAHAEFTLRKDMKHKRGRIELNLQEKIHNVNFESGLDFNYKSGDLKVPNFLRQF